MPAQALYLKWRPRTFEDVIGQDHITRTLRNALRQGRIRHAYLFSGPRGTGKTSTARLLAKAVNCLNPDPDRRPCDVCAPCVAVNEGRFLDLIEIDAASHTGVDDVRDLRDRIAFSPGEGRYKIYIIDEVHRFSGAAFDALLKTLEEPPEHAIFVLATTEIAKVPATIKSRCQLFEFRRVSLAEVTARLAQIAEAEGVSIEPAALELIAREGTGSVRDSISLLDQLIADPSVPITLAMAEQILGTASSQQVLDLVDALIAGDAARGLDVINLAIDSGADPRQFGQQVIAHLRQVLLVRMGGESLVDAPDERRAVLRQQAAQVGQSALLAALRAFNNAVAEWRGGWQPQLPLEMAFLECLRPAAGPEPAPSSARVERPQPSAPAPATVAEAPPPPRAEGVSGVRLSDVLEAWPRIQSTARDRDRALPALLEHVTPREVRGEVLVLSVSSPIFKQKIEAQDKRAALEAALYQALGARLKFSVIVIDEAQIKAPGANNALATDDVLAFGVNELGGELTELDE